jgi:hypothetical protein
MFGRFANHAALNHIRLDREDTLRKSKSHFNKQAGHLPPEDRNRFGRISMPPASIDRLDRSCREVVDIFREWAKLSSELNVSNPAISQRTDPFTTRRRISQRMSGDTPGTMFSDLYRMVLLLETVKHFLPG